MLSSSDAKWRCMWHMLVWSLVMTLVSQFLDIRDHYAFFFFAATSVLVMPVLTAVYSNSSGRHCAGLLRAGYVFWDPVLVCITITPVQLLSRLPKYLDEYFCLTLYSQWNRTLECLHNKTWTSPLTHIHKVDNFQRENLINDKHEKILVIQGCLVVPILLSLMMGRRSHKMAVHTYIFTFAYWLIAAIEASDLLETALISKVYKHTIFTTEAIVSIVMIIVNAYAIVTLCSFLTPTPGDDKMRVRNFDFVYRAFVGVAGIFFVELPMLIARFQIIGTDTGRVIHGSFYMWVTKDIIFTVLIIIILLHQKFRKKYVKYFKAAPCTAPFDNPSVSFEPEKRDVYIHRQKKVRFQSPPVIGATPPDATKPKATGSILRTKHKEQAQVPITIVATPTSDSEAVKQAAGLLSASAVNATASQPLPNVTVAPSPLSLPAVLAPVSPTSFSIPTTSSDTELQSILYPSASDRGPVSLTSFPQISSSSSMAECPLADKPKPAEPAEDSPVTIEGSQTETMKQDSSEDPPAKKRKTLPKEVEVLCGADTLTPHASSVKVASGDVSDSDMSQVDTIAMKHHMVNDLEY